MATYGDLDPNAMPDMYNKEYVEPVSGQGLISSLFAGSPTKVDNTNQVMANMGSQKPLKTGVSIFPESYPTDVDSKILAQITDPIARSDIGDKDVIGADSFEDPNAMKPFGNRFDTPAGDLKADMSAPDPKNFTQNISDAVNKVVPEGMQNLLGTPEEIATRSPFDRTVNVVGKIGKGIGDAGIDVLTEAEKALEYFFGAPGDERDAEIKSTGDIGEEMKGRYSSDLAGAGKNVYREIEEILSNIDTSVPTSNSSDRNLSGVFSSPSSVAEAIDTSTDATNPNSPNMSTGPSMRLNEMTVKNPDAIPILPGQEPGGGRSGADSIIQSLGLLEMSEADRAARIARLPEGTRDAVLQRVTDMMQSASVGDNIEL